MLQEFAQEVKNTITEILHGVHTAIPGKIVKYYPDKCEAEILPFCKFKKPNGEFIDYPQLNHIPILFPQSMGQDCTMVYPIQPGDECLILAQEQTLDTWRGGGSESNNDLRFDLTNAVAIMGMFAKAQPLAQEAQDEDKIIIQKNDHRIHIKPDELMVRYSPANFILLNPTGMTIKTQILNIVADMINTVSATTVTEAAGVSITETAPTINLNP